MSDLENPSWIHGDKPLESIDIQDYVGMVYLIVNKMNDKKYIGKKFFWSTRKLPPLKGKTRKRTKVVETDWKKYWGSSNQLQEDIKTHGTENFERYVLRLCETKTECAYIECYYQMLTHSLIREDFYNDFAGGKITGRHLTYLKEELNSITTHKLL